MKVQGICDSCGKTGAMPNGVSKPLAWWQVSVSGTEVANLTYCPACYSTIVWPVGLLATPDPIVTPKLPVAP